MSLNRWNLGLVSLGLLLALTIAELGIRLAGDAVPFVGEWPTPEAEVKYRQLVDEGRDPDVIFLGTSFVEAAIDPDQMPSGVESYNLAMPFSTFDSMAWWLEHVVFTLEMQPDTIVIGVPLWTDLDAGNTALVDALESASERAASDRGGLRLWQALGSLGQLDQSLARQRLFESDTWTESGHQTGYFVRVEPLASWERLHNANAGPQELADLRRLIELAEQRAPEVLLLVEPLASSVLPDRAGVETYVGNLRELADDVGIVLLEPPPAFWSDALYVDGMHPTAQGASQFTVFIGEEITPEFGRAFPGD